MSVPDPQEMDRRQRLRERLVARLGEAGDDSGQLSAVLVTANAAEQSQPFALTDLQEAYWIGRRDSGTACHGYAELDVENLDPARLQAAIDRLVQRHPMLRAVIDADGRQRILPDVAPYRLPFIDATGPDAAQLLAATRAEMSHQVLPADRWPLWDIRAAHTGSRTARLHISFDILIADALSFRILAGELADLYEHPDSDLAPLAITFRDYVTHVDNQREGPDRDADWNYWRERLATLPTAPQLPSRPDLAGSAQFARFETRIAADTWALIRENAGNHGVSAASAVMAGFAETIGGWAAARDFTLNLTLFDRRPLHPDINRVVGPFTDISLLAVRLPATGTFADLAAALQSQMWQDLQHRSVSGVEILRELHRTGLPAAMPVVFTYVQDPGQDDFRAGMSRLGRVGYALSQTPQVLVDCQVAEAAGECWLWWDAVAGAFPEGMVSEMFATFADLVARLADKATWTGTDAARLPDVAALRAGTQRCVELAVRPLHQLRARPDGNHPAVVDATGTLTYGQLDAAVNGVAHRLCALGIGAGDLVAVHAAGGADRAVAVLAVCAAGAGYLPLDSLLPPTRLANLAHRAGIAALITGEAAGAPVDWLDAAVPVLNVRGGTAPVDGELPDVPMDATAYVIYTSGSTGVPKGVRVSHLAAANTIVDINERYGLHAQDRVFAVSSVGFDLSVWDMFGTLAAGATVVSADPGQAGKDPARWLSRMLDERVTVWNSVPALMGLLMDVCEVRRASLPDLRLVLLSGDWIPLGLPERIRQVAPGARVISLGGATEAAIWSVAYDTAEPDRGWSSVPYGFPLTNQALYVLDEAGRERPVAAVGELFIGGTGLAEGYHREPELTAAAFVEHPDLGRLYRTGDLVRRHGDGCLEFLGRRDDQVKIQGHRVELAEVEAALLRLPGVRAAVAAALGERDGQRQLVACVVTENAGSDMQLLRQRLAAVMPAYLVPARLVAVEQLPLTANGKMDRGRLAELVRHTDDAQPAAQLVRQQHSPLGEYLLSRVRDWLGDPQLPIDADLVAAGLDSIDLVRLANRLEKELDFRPAHEDLVRTPSVAAVQHMFEEDLLRRLGDGGLTASVGGPADAAQLIRRAVARRMTLFGLPGIALTETGDDEKTEYHSARRLAGGVPVGQLAQLLGVLRATGSPAGYRYPSAGGSYAVRTFVHARPGGIDGLAPGLYFYNPVEHRLALFADVALAAYWYAPDNQHIAEGAGAALYLAVDSAALLPQYGPDTARYAALEAGSMAMLLRQGAGQLGIGLCQIGSFTDGEVTTALGLAARTDLVATVLIGAAVDGGGDVEDGFV